MNLQEYINAGYSYNRISVAMGICFAEAKQAVLDHFEADPVGLSTYKTLVKAEFSKIMSRVSKGPRKIKKRTVYEQIMRRTSLPKSPAHIEYYVKISEYFDNLKVEKFTSLHNGFILKQLKNFVATPDQYFEYFKIWYESGCKWNSMDINSWIVRYGQELGTAKYEERMRQCDMTYSKTPEELAAIKKTISDGVNAYVSGTTKLQRQQNSVRSIEFYLKRGFSREEGQAILDEILADLKARTNWATNNLTNYPESRNTNIQYWIKRFGEELGAILYKNRQSTFSLKTCIEKHGEQKGKLIFQQRQENGKAH